MGTYLTPIPPHSGLTGLQGGRDDVGEFYHFTREEHDYLVALFSGISTVSATTFYSGSTDLSSLLAPRTFVQPGINITTGGTLSAPIVSLKDSINLSEILVNNLTVADLTTFDSSVLLRNNTYVGPGALIFSALSTLFMQTINKNEILYAEENVGFPYQRIVGNSNFTFNPNTELFTVDNISAQTISFDQQLIDKFVDNEEGHFYWKLGGSLLTSPYLYYDNNVNTVVLGANFSATSIIYSGGQDLGELFSAPIAQQRTLYVAKNGNNSNGSTFANAFTTISGAVQYYTSVYNNASAVNPFTIKVVDTGSYHLVSPLAIPNYVYIDAHQSDLYGRIILGDGSKFWVKNHFPRTNVDSPLVQKSAITTTSYYKADVLDMRGSGGTLNIGIGIQSSGSTGQMFVDIKKIYVRGIGLGSLGGSANGHIHLNIEDLYLADNNAIGIRSEGTSGTSIVGYVHHILESGNFNSTTAFELYGGRISIVSTEMFADTFAYVGNGADSQLDIVCPYIVTTTPYSSDFGNEIQIDRLTKNIVSSTFLSNFKNGLNATFITGTTISGGTIYSGGTPMNTILSEIQTFVQPGTNITTGGTKYRPSISVIDNPSFLDVSVTNVFYSGETDLTHVIEGQRDLLKYVEINDDYEITPSIDFIIGVNTRSSPINITLPSSVSSPMWWYIVKDMQGSAEINAIQVRASGDDKIVDDSAGAASVQLSTNGGGATFYNTGTGNWICLRSA